MQDIYGLDSLSILIRVDAKDAAEFEKNNEIRFNNLKKDLENLEVECYFQKLGKELHKIYVPIYNGFLIIHVKLHISETYQALIDGNKRTTFLKNSQPPDKDYIQETVIIKIIDINERGRSTDDFILFFKKVESLPIICSSIDVQKHHQIWNIWIEAQQTIWQHLQTPYQVKSHRLEEIKNDYNEIIRYKLTLFLKNEILDEYKQIENQLHKLDIKAKFNNDGSIYLTKDEISLLDSIIARNFSIKVERIPSIIAILKIKPLKLAQKIQNEITFQTFQNPKKKQIYIQTQANQNLNQIMKGKGFVFKHLQGKFTVLNHGNILENNEIITKYNITFGNIGFKTKLEKGFYLPKPKNNVFQINGYVNELNEFYTLLNQIFGEENVLFTIQSVYEAVRDDIIFEENEITEDFWKHLRSKLYSLNLENNLHPEKECLLLEFKDFEELESNLAQIEKTNTCYFVYNPNTPSFKFKVKLKINTKKTEVEIFKERLMMLAGVEFVCEHKVAKEQKPKKSLFVGNLLSYESDIQKLVFHIPYKKADEKAKAEGIISLLKNNNIISPIQEVHANLVGDLLKITWLKNAVKKIVQPTTSHPNGMPVNPNLGSFIFDSSKATPIYDEAKLEIGSEYYEALKQNELLRLNGSQRRAVLSAIYSDDLALLQGPPGTGKTTVIAEIIWQLISKNPRYKILLTSETNLAVDNAIDRLLNTKGLNPSISRYVTLIKPVRLGKVSKMDEEGAKYSIERIMSWAEENYQNTFEGADALAEKQEEYEEDTLRGSIENNAVQEWMNKIAERAQNHNYRYAKALKQWTKELSMPTKEVKKIFKDKYIEYANVIGSTCTSCGNPAFLWELSIIYKIHDANKKTLYNKALNAPYDKKFKNELSNFEIPKEI